MDWDLFLLHRTPPLIRNGCVVLIFAAAVWIESWLAHYPVPKNLANNIVNPTADLGKVEVQDDQELVIRQPRTESLHLPVDIADVDVEVDRGVLMPNTVKRLVRHRHVSGLTTVPGFIKYITDGDPAMQARLHCGEPTGTDVDITFQKDSAPIRELRFMEKGKPATDLYPTLELSASGGGLVVNLIPHFKPCPDEDKTPYWKSLWLDQSPAASPIQLNNRESAWIAAADGDRYPGSAMRIYFRPFPGGAPAESTKVVEPFGTAQILYASEVILQANSENRVQNSELPLRSFKQVEGYSPLKISKLRLDAESLKVLVEGTAWIKSNGQPESVNLLDRMKSSPLLAGVITALDGALIAWFVGIFTFKRPESVGESKALQRVSNPAPALLDAPADAVPPGAKTTDTEAKINTSRPE